MNSEKLAELVIDALDDDARAAMQRFLDEEADKPNSVHEHRPAGFGLDPGAIRERFREYCEHFDLGSA